MKNRLNFTKAALSALPTPAQKRTYYRDSRTRGLILSVTPNGTRSYFLYRKIGGRPEKILLGHFGDLTVEQARNRATQLNAQIAAGGNPADQRRLARAEMTLGELYGEYLNRHAKKNTKWWAQGEALFKRYCTQADHGGARLADCRLSTITRSHIAHLHSRISNTHPVTANRVLALISSVFGWAIKAGLWELANPASGIAKNRERSRERFLRADEMPRFFQAVAQEKNTTLRDYVLLSLFTGARQMNVLTMTWDQVDFKDRLWHIPETKNGTPHIIPLSPEAIAVLEMRRGNASAEERFVFTGSGKRGHLTEPKAGWYRILRRANIENLRLHDLRRTLGSWQAATGASLTIIGKTLNHKHPASTAVYARLSLDPVRKALEIANAAIQAAAYPARPAPVSLEREHAHTSGTNSPGTSPPRGDSPDVISLDSPEVICAEKIL